MKSPPRLMKRNTHKEEGVVADSEIDVKNRKLSISQRVSIKETNLDTVFTQARERKNHPGACIKAKQRV